MNREPVWGSNYLKALVWLGGLVGATSAAVGVLTNDGGEVLVAIGTVGGTALLLLLIAGNVFEPKLERNEIPRSMQAAFVGACVAVGVVLYIWAGQGLAGDARRNGMIVGVMVLVGAFLFGVYQFNQRERAEAAAHKRCPDCANDVLSAARVCEHCGFSFAIRSHPPES